LYLDELHLALDGEVLDVARVDGDGAEHGWHHCGPEHVEEAHHHVGLDLVALCDVDDA